MTRSKKKRAVTIVCLVLAVGNWGVLGCDRPTAGKADPTPKIVARAAPWPSATATTPAQPGSQTSEVAAAVETWRLKQEKLDFDGYAALYGEAFRGVKRVSEQRYFFDRKGWLADRKSMFRPGLAINVKQLAEARVEDHVVAAFTQEFASPSYRDVGRKVLTFERTQAGLRIVREELLTSEVLGGGGSIEPLPGFFFARDDAVVLRSEVAEAWLTPARRARAQAYRAWAESPDDSDEVEESFLTLSDLVLPPEVTALLGKTLYVSRVGPPAAAELPPPCQARVVRIEVVNTAQPSFESVRGVLRYGHVYGSVILGVFDKVCRGARWASEAPMGPQYLPQKLSGPVRQMALSLFRTLAEYRTKQALYEQQSAGQGPWEVSDNFVDTVMMGASDKKRSIFVEGQRGLYSESFMILGLLLEVQPTATGQQTGTGQPAATRIVSLGVVADNVLLTPELAFDLDNDGTLEVLVSESNDDASWHVIYNRGGKPKREQVYFSPNFVCPG